MIQLCLVLQSVLCFTALASIYRHRIRRTIVALVLPRVIRAERLRASRSVLFSELGIRYRKSPAVVEGTPALLAGRRAGDRFPDAEVTRNGRATTLHRELAGPWFHLLLCGEPDAGDQHDDAAATVGVRRAGYWLFIA